jgi:hypothetical protein
MLEPFVVLFLLIPLPNLWAKGLDCGVFIVLGLVVFLAEIPRFLLIQRVLVDHNFAMECLWGVPTTPKVLCESVERIGRSGVGSGGVDPRVLFIPSCPGVTGALDWSDRCNPFVGFASGDFLDPCVFELCCCWSVIGRFGIILLGFGGVSVPGPREVTGALWNVCCAAAVATGLTGSVHRSDRCHQSNRRRPSVWPV